jgi:hypothetical protein
MLYIISDYYVRLVFKTDFGSVWDILGQELSLIAAMSQPYCDKN